MSEPTRQLAAIMFSDIVGYTAAMNKDESAAFLMLDKNRSIQKPLIEANGGRLLKEIGDGILASFNSALDAVECANKIQISLQNDLEFKVRIGIHLGDVIFQNNDVFGDGVNIASRLEVLSPPGGIYISETVFQNIKNIPDIHAEFVKVETLKNVLLPVKIYRIGSNDSITSNVPQHEKSIAVLPFVNMSNDAEQEYFCDGLAEDLLNLLAQIKGLKVAARTSTFSFKDKNVNITEIGNQLKVRTVLEGSVRKSGDELRITAQLINCEDGYNLWSERYDRHMNDIFAIQDEIAFAIASKLKITLLEKDRALIAKRPTQNTDAYEKYLMGRFYLNKRIMNQGIDLFKQAISLAPDFAPAYAGLADALVMSAGYSLLPSKEKQFAEDALRIDPLLCEPCTQLMVHLSRRQPNWLRN